MPAPRSTTIRGTRTPRATKPSAPRPEEFAPEDVDNPRQPRDVVSYALARRAALETMRRGGAFNSDYCDADPNLLRAAKFHGEPVERPCPVCGRADMVDVRWVYGAQLGPLSGSARSTDELATMAHEHGRFRVYVVEVCPACTWNHLVMTFALGDGRPRANPRKAASGT